MDEKIRKLQGQTLLLNAIVAVVMFIMVGLYLSFIVRMTPEQRVNTLFTGMAVALIFLGGYLFLARNMMGREMMRAEALRKGGEGIRALEILIGLPVRLALIAFFFWIIGSGVCGVVFYFFVGFSPLQSFEAFLLGMCGGFFAPLLSYYLFKVIFRRFSWEEFSEALDPVLYERIPSFSLFLKVVLPFMISIIVVFILVLTLSIRMRNDLVSGTLKRIGEKELSLMKKGEGPLIGTPLTIDLVHPEGRIATTIVEVLKKGRNFYIDPVTLNLFVFEKADEKRIDGLIYSYKDLVGYPLKGTEWIWSLGVFSVGILVFIPYLVIRDFKDSIKGIKAFLEEGKKVLPTDDEFNLLYSSITRLKTGLEKKVNSLNENFTFAESRLSRMMQFLAGMEEDIKTFERILQLTTEALEKEKEGTSGIKNLLEEMTGFSTKDESHSLDAALKDKLLRSEELLKILRELTDSKKKVLSSMMERKNKSLPGLTERVESFRKSTQRFRNAVDSFKKHIDEIKNLSEAKTLVSNIGLKAEEAKSASLNFLEEIRTIANSIEKAKGDFQKIEEMAKVIKEIIDETNLLSLNASIIAAQAGEKGKSFAVVAEEIKELAERTEISAGEISQVVAKLQSYIENSFDKFGALILYAEDFKRLWEETTEKLEVLMSEMGKIDGFLSNILRDHQEYSSLSSEIELAGRDMEEVLFILNLYQDAIESLKDSLSTIESFTEFLITSRNLLEDCVNFLKRLKEEESRYMKKKEEMKNFFLSLSGRVSELSLSLAEGIKLLKTIRIKIKEVQ